MKYYTLIFRWACITQIEAYANPKEFGARVAELYMVLQAPSMVGTWSTWADDETDAIEQAKFAFKKDGWEL